MIQTATIDDFDFFYHLYMHPQVNPYLSYEMMNEQEFKPLYAELIRQKCLYIFSVNAEPAGMFKLIRLQHRCGHIMYLGGFAVDPSYAGKNYGLSMMQELIGFARQQGCLRIELSTATDNTRALALYKKAGFEQEGILRKYTYLKSENRFIDEVMMSLLL